MLQVLQVIAVMLAAVAMALALAHALELPGKMRLAKQQYLAVQPIYYPGFTIAGAAEPLAAVAVLALLFVLPGDLSFWLAAGALLSLLAMQATYWLLTHPVNNFWLAKFDLDRASGGFFGLDPFNQSTRLAKDDWTRLRDRWEISHVVRAGFGMLSLALLATALVN
jgi:hypothetical protein